MDAERDLESLREKKKLELMEKEEQKKKVNI